MREKSIDEKVKEAGWDDASNIVLREPEKDKGGRPVKDFSKKEFEKLCAMQCTEQEICDWFSTTDKTLSNWCKRTYGQGFSEVYKQKRSIGKISLRRTQFHLAEKSAAMAIWLGKQYLGQKDEVAVESSNNEFLQALTDLARKKMND